MGLVPGLGPLFSYRLNGDSADFHGQNLILLRWVLSDVRSRRDRPPLVLVFATFNILILPPVLILNDLRFLSVQLINILHYEVRPLNRPIQRLSFIFIWRRFSSLKFIPLSSLNSDSCLRVKLNLPTLICLIIIIHVFTILCYLNNDLLIVEFMRV
jgi:hypothetical protein